VAVPFWPVPDTVAPVPLCLNALAQFGGRNLCQHRQWTLVQHDRRLLPLNLFQHI